MPDMHEEGHAVMRGVTPQHGHSAAYRTVLALQMVCSVLLSPLCKIANMQTARLHCLPVVSVILDAHAPS